MMTTIRPVLAFQVAYPYLTEDLLYYIQKYYGAPNQYFYGLAGAIYAQAASGTYTTTSSLLAAMQTSLTSQNQFMNPDTITQPAFGIDQQYQNVSLNGMAHDFGLKSLGYEGGPDASLTTSSTTAIEQLYLPNSGIASLINNFYGEWFGCGNDMVNYYNLATAMTGQWGIYEDPELPNAKSAAILQIANTPLSSFTTCH